MNPNFFPDFGGQVIKEIDLLPSHMQILENSIKMIENHHKFE